MQYVYTLMAEFRGLPYAAQVTITLGLTLFALLVSGTIVDGIAHWLAMRWRYRGERMGKRHKATWVGRG